MSTTLKVVISLSGYSFMPSMSLERSRTAKGTVSWRRTKTLTVLCHTCHGYSSMSRQYVNLLRPCHAHY
jgi:hypothetical protein